MSITKHQNHIKSDLRIFLFIIFLLIIIGLIFIYSSSSIFALEKCGTSHFFVKKQLIGVFLGFIALIVTSLVPLSLVARLSPLFYLSTLMLTAFTLLKKMSLTIHGSSRWLSIFGLSFQPSELLKIGLILYLARLLVKKEPYLNSFWCGYIPFLVILGITSLVLLIQPDFGSTITVCATTFIMLFIANFNSTHLLITLGAFLPFAAALIYLKPYRWKRILTFLNPWNDPQGSGFQIIQSLIAIGSGNVLGIGIAKSKQKFFYLPMQHTDFIFSIIAEETGFLGTFGIISLFMLFLIFGLRIAWQFKDQFSAYATIGFVVVTSLQAAVNILVVTGLLPTKGLGLPFISYGLSALICNMAMVGLIINMVRSD